MMNDKQKTISLLSLLFLVISIFLDITRNLKIEDYNKISYKMIDTRSIAVAKISKKVDVKPIPLAQLLSTDIKTGISLKNEKVEEIKTVKETPVIVERKWYLPTEMGTISQYPSYGHAAYDIISPRGYNEAVYPVANGVVSSKYYDNYGALIVTVFHNIDGRKYTSMYVHLSSYAPDIYVGREVTVNTRLGQMGSSGFSTGVHLHLTVIDCALYGDSNCYDLNSFFNYANIRLTQGYYGLGNQIEVPYSWSSR